MKDSTVKTYRGKVLLVDDRKGDIAWLVDYLEKRGYHVDHVTNEQAARGRLEQIVSGKQRYILAIIDIMVALKDIMDMIELADELNETFFENSRTTGIRLCRWIRGDLDISSKDLPIVCISARPDIGEIETQLEEIDPEIQVFGQMAENPEVFRNWLEDNL